MYLPTEFNEETYRFLLWAGPLLRRAGIYSAHRGQEERRRILVNLFGIEKIFVGTNFEIAKPASECNRHEIKNAVGVLQEEARRYIQGYREQRRRVGGKPPIDPQGQFEFRGTIVKYEPKSNQLTKEEARGHFARG